MCDWSSIYLPFYLRSIYDLIAINLWLICDLSAMSDELPTIMKLAKNSILLWFICDCSVMSDNLETMVKLAKNSKIEKSGQNRKERTESKRADIQVTTRTAMHKARG